MRVLGQHAAVFCVGLSIAVLVALFSPYDVDPKEVLFVFVPVFFLYLGISVLLKMRRKRDGADIQGR